MKPVIRSKAIRTKCLDCSKWQQSEVRECPVIKCPLWPWRMGKQPSAEDLEKLKNVDDEPEYQKEKQISKSVPQSAN